MEMSEAVGKAEDAERAAKQSEQGMDEDALVLMAASQGWAPRYWTAYLVCGLSYGALAVVIWGWV